MAGPGRKNLRVTDRSLFADKRILLIEGRYYEDIGDALLEGARAEIDAVGATFSHVIVPGALEIPQALSLAVEKGIIGSEATNRQFHGAVALGCVIRGETYHFEIVSDQLDRNALG